MPTCRFFAQGYCKFGDNCRFDHDQGGGNRYQWSRNNRGNDRFFSQTQQGKQTGELSLEDTIAIIIEEMKVWESGKIWPFSCYAYMKDGKCLSGFDDCSPEELRYEAYLAKSAGPQEIANYAHKVNELTRRFNAKREELRLMVPSVRNRVQEEIKANKTSGTASSVSNTTTAFGSGLRTPAFGQASATSPPTGLFGGQTTKPHSNSSFGQSASFGGGSTALFGGQSTTGFGGGGGGSGLLKPATFGSGNQQTSGFGSSAQSFAPAQSQSTAFGSAKQTPFGSSNQSTTAFGQIGSSASNQKPAPLFGGSAQMGGGTAFGQPAVTSQRTGLFGASGGGGFGMALPQPAASFGTANTNTFGTAQSSANNSFGARTQPATNVTSGFGTATNNSQSASSGTAVAVSPLYTPMDQLTAEEKEQFTAADFTLGKIPSRPPPRELCS